MTSKIDAASLIDVYKALGLEASGKVAVKLHTGEPGNTHYLKASLIKDFIQSVNGTIVESNVAYSPSRRLNTATHYEVAKEHGFTDIAKFVILDENSDISLPVVGGEVLRENFVGAHFSEYDFHIVLSHFKGHGMGGYGGALKNMSIGYASSAGKSWIHSGGTSKTGFSGDQNTFLKSMAEAAKSVADANKGKILYINVMNNISIDCDCMSNPARPSIADIGILASLDPVALDQACLDLVDKAPNNTALLQRIQDKNGRLTVEHAAKIGLGKRAYNLVNID
jgi:uncharacterized Fe-S center protein